MVPMAFIEADAQAKREAREAGRVTPEVPQGSRRPKDLLYLPPLNLEPIDLPMLGLEEMAQMASSNMLPNMVPKGNNIYSFKSRSYTGDTNSSSKRSSFRCNSSINNSTRAKSKDSICISNNAEFRQSSSNSDRGHKLCIQNK